MQRRLALALLPLLLVFALMRGSTAAAQSAPVQTSFVQLGPGVPGVLYLPNTPGPHSQIGIFVMHSGADYLSFSACTELSRRGYRVLCANNTTSKADTSDDGSLDRMLLDARLGVAYLKQYPGIRKVVLLGHSGGGTLMSAYQTIAENGVQVCQGPEKIIPCPSQLAGLPRADGLMLLDSNWGLSAMTLFSLDPAVVSRADGRVLNPELDLFNPRNGFNPEGSDYPAAFVHRFLHAEGRRETDLIADAQSRLTLIQRGQGAFADDESFTVAGANFRGPNNRLFAQDPRLMSHTRNPWPLLHANGTLTTGIVHSVRVPANTVSTVRSFEQGALKTTVRDFLNTFAIRVTSAFGYDEDSVQGVEWTSTYSSPPGNVEGVTVPLLLMGMTGHWEYLASETIAEHARSSDKTLVFVEGATHTFTPCTPCEQAPGQFGDTQKATYDYVDRWLGMPGRFLPGP